MNTNVNVCVLNSLIRVHEGIYVLCVRVLRSWSITIYPTELWVFGFFFLNFLSPTRKWLSGFNSGSPEIYQFPNHQNLWMLPYMARVNITLYGKICD